MSAMPEDGPPHARQIEKLKKINAALISRLERTHDGEPNAFAMFENAVTVERQVRQQTEDLRQAMHALERSNDALNQAKLMAEAANALKTSFLAAVSHDLLQPLHAARLTLSVLSDVTGAPNGALLVAQADRSLSTLEEILKTLLDLSKLDAGVSKPERRCVRLSGLIDDLCAEFAPNAADHGLVLRHRGTDAAVLTDPLMLRRILQNLLSNAIRYTRRGGVLLSCIVHDTFLRIDVADTGPGIQPDRRVAIFEEFQRDDPGVGNEPGFGLGLAIVRRLALAMGHDIKLWSRPGLGSVFSVVVPRGQGEEIQSNLGEASVSKPFEDVQILILTKDPPAMQSTMQLLGTWGCSIVHAASREDAHIQLQSAERAPDLLIAACGQGDVHLALEMIEGVRVAAGSPIPAFLIGTGGNASAPGIEVLQQPIRPAELRALIAHLLAQPI